MCRRWYRARTPASRIRHTRCTVFAAGSGGGPAELRVVCRYHVCAAAARILVSGGRAGLVQSVRVAWALSNTLEARFCLEAVDQALASGQPEIFNTDEGAQFTGAAFTGQLAEARSGSAWMGAAGRWTTSLWSGCGGCEVRGGLSARLRRWGRTWRGGMVL